MIQNDALQRSRMKKRKNEKKRMTQAMDIVSCKARLYATAVARKATSHQTVKTKTESLKTNGFRIKPIRIT